MNATINAPTTRPQRITPSTLLVLVNIALGLVIAALFDGLAYALCCVVLIAIVLCCVALSLASLQLADRAWLWLEDVAFTLRALRALSKQRRALSVLPDETTLLAERLNAESKYDESEGEGEDEQ